jgi:hypothetical protein
MTGVVPTVTSASGLPSRLAPTTPPLAPCPAEIDTASNGWAGWRSGDGGEPPPEPPDPFGGVAPLGPEGAGEAADAGGGWAGPDVVAVPVATPDGAPAPARR